jgi:hypothetical protein
LLHRVLDGLFDPTLVAVGAFKIAPDYDDLRWKCEMHLIIAGAAKNDLVTGFSATRPGTGGGNIQIDVVGDLSKAVRDVTECNVQPRRSFFQQTVGKQPKKPQRSEFYRWLLGLSVNARAIRHGCDLHLNRVRNRKPKTLKPRAKRRGYPDHLMPYMFGNREHDVNSGTFEPKNPNDRIGEAPPDYYNDDWGAVPNTRRDRRSKR